MNTQLIFSSEGIERSGYFIFLFLFLLGVELIFTRRLTRPGRNWLYAVLVIYLGLPFMGYLLPLMDLDNTTKRGLFKLFPLMLLYFGSNGVLVRLSERISRWERKTPV
jgi:Kef-type K+ transport system membrane component KefB